VSIQQQCRGCQTNRHPRQTPAGSAAGA